VVGVAPPDEGNGEAAGVEDPSTEYMVAVRDAPVKFTITRKK